MDRLQIKKEYLACLYQVLVSLNVSLFDSHNDTRSFGSYQSSDNGKLLHKARDICSHARDGIVDLQGTTVNWR